MRTIDQRKMLRALIAVLVPQLLCGCIAQAPQIDRSLASLEAIVVQPLSEGWISDVNVKFYSAELRVTHGEDHSVSRVMVSCPCRDLVSEDNPLRQVGAVILFQTERRFLKKTPYWVGSDPTIRYSYNLLVENMVELRTKQPNQSPKPASGPAPGRGSSLTTDRK